MKSILAALAMTALIVFPATASAETMDSVSSVTTVQAVTVSGSAGVNL